MSPLAILKASGSFNYALQLLKLTSFFQPPFHPPPECKHSAFFLSLSNPNFIMGDVAVESPAHVTPYTKSAPLDTIPNIESIEGTANDGGDEYATLKKLQRHLEYAKRPSLLPSPVLTTAIRYIQLQEEYIKDEQRYDLSFCSHSNIN